MKNNFFHENIDEITFNEFSKNIYNFKVGFYSVGLYPASLAYNCAMHSDKENILLSPRPGRDLLGAFSDNIISEMDPKIIQKILKMGSCSDLRGNRPNELSDLILKCNIIILASNSNHIQDDITLAIKLRKSLKRENVVIACLVGSFCLNDRDKKPFILCEKYPELAFFSGFHRHGALRNPFDSFTANFCHPNSITAFIGAKILNQLSPKIQVSAGVHNIECQYIKAIKNVSSIFAGFVSNYHSDKPGMLPTINTILLSQCFDQAASVSSFVRKEKNIQDNVFSLKDLGYGIEKIKAGDVIKNQLFEKRDHTFSQLNAVTADVLGSMTLPIEGNPTRNFQAGQVLSEMFYKLKRCPNDISEFVEWCNKFSLSKGALEGLKSLQYWPNIYRQYDIKNNNCSMINLIYLCFYANTKEKEDIYNVLIDAEEITNYCQESVRQVTSIELKFKLEGIDIFKNYHLLYKSIFNKFDNLNLSQDDLIKNESIEDLKYLKVIKLINKYFTNLDH